MLQLFFDIAKSRELVRHQLQVITFLFSSILSSDREMNNLPFELAGPARARRVALLKLFNLLYHKQNKNLDVHIVENDMHVLNLLNLNVARLR